jgi:hypothetical protein
MGSIVTSFAAPGASRARIDQGRPTSSAPGRTRGATSARTHSTNDRINSLSDIVPARRTHAVISAIGSQGKLKLAGRMA